MPEILIQWYCFIPLFVAALGVMNYIWVVVYAKFCNGLQSITGRSLSANLKARTYKVSRHLLAAMLIGIWGIELRFIRALVTFAVYNPSIALPYFIFQYAAIVSVILLSVIFTGMFLFKNYKGSEVLKNYPLGVVMLTVIWILSFFAVFMLMTWMPLNN